MLHNATRCVCVAIVPIMRQLGHGSADDMETKMQAIVIAAALLLPGIALAQSASLQELQRGAIQRRQSDAAQIEARDSTREQLARAIPEYMKRAVTRLKSRGVRFKNTETTIVDCLKRDKLYGLGTGRASFLDAQKTIGVANEYVFFVLPEGYNEPFQLKGDMHWDNSTSGCRFWIDFSFNPSKSHPVGEYECADFLAGKSDAQFSSTFESAVRQGFVQERR